METTEPAALRYTLAVLVVAAALLLRILLWPLLGQDLPFLFLWPAVMCSAWVGGFWPGVLATLLSALAGRFFIMAPLHSLIPASLPDGVGIGLYLCLGVLLSYLIEGFHSARRLAERHAAELNKQREWLRVTLISIGDAVIATDPQARIVFINNVAQQLTGWSEEDAKGQLLDKVLRIVSEETHQHIENPAERVLATGSIVGMANHALLLGRDGIEVPIDDSAAPICTEQGEILGVVIVFRDTAERRRLERELQRRAKELIEADERKNDFLAMLAHELRTPLAPIGTGIEILKHVGNRDSVIVEAVDIIDRQARHMTRLVGDLMDIARISRGKISIHKEPLVLSEVVKRAVEMSQSFFDSRRQQLTVRLSEEPIHVQGDRTRLMQVTTNLLGNAAKYTKEGGSIFLCVEQQEGFAVLRIRDNGIGIAPEVLPHVFDLYFQSGRAIDRAAGGLGIGLKLVGSLVEMHGGTIEAFSEGVGKGSEFIVRLPMIGTESAPETVGTV
jgi:PAS domain S-box-containing protein